MTGKSDIIERWIDVAFDRTTKDNYSSRNSNVWAQGDSIYSYGTHFEMARVMRDAKGDPSWFLVNGDRYSVTTSGHQSAVRSGVARTGMPSIIIPYDALQAAAIDYTSIEIVDVQPDRWETTEHETNERPPGSKWEVRWEYGNVALSPAEIAELVAKKNKEKLDRWQTEREWGARDVELGKLDSMWLRASMRAPLPPRPMGEECIRDHERTARRPVRVDDVVLRGRGYNFYDVQANEDGSLTYSWSTTRHWLGESLIRARIRWGGHTLCKPCRGSGVDPELQGPPEPEGSWEWPTDNPNANDRVWVPRPGRRNRWASNWEAREATFCDKCNGRGGKDFTRSRLAYFLSGFDSQEATALYFFCELPKGVAPQSVEEAYECLKPQAVKLAEELGRDITRQGDIFAIPVTTLDRRALRKRGARFEKRGNLLNTNHEATEVAYLPDGTTLARGVLYHNPDWRRPDHARRKLAEGWNAVLKNTVPVAA